MGVRDAEERAARGRISPWRSVRRWSAARASRTGRLLAGGSATGGSGRRQTPSLRRRLTLTMIGVLAVGLAAANVVIFVSVRSFLYGRLDDQLDVAQHQAYQYLAREASTGRGPTLFGLENRISPDVYVMVLDSEGQVVLRRPSGSFTRPDPQPLLPRSMRIQTTLPQLPFGNSRGTFHPEPDAVDLGAVGDPSSQYRASAVAVPGGVLVTAVSLNATGDTLHSLVKMQVGASLAVVLVLCGLTLLTIRQGLRPLEDMATTAGAIAAGDLSRRVPAAGSTSEVDRLGQALNVMLARIELAFDEKSMSEARLRQFVADASHELRTPLTSIRGYAELLRKGAFPDDAGQRRALSRIEHEAARMGGLVDDLLLLARLDQGRPLDVVPVDLSQVGAEAVEDARAVDPARSVELVADAPVVVAGDRDRLRQLAHNMVRNALAHTPPGTPVSVIAKCEGAAGVLTVEDRGPGLQPEEAARVFDRFYRSDAARSTRGTGLGLAIVRAIAEALGGTADVASEPGRGAAFSVRVPLSTVPVSPPAPGSAAWRAPAPA